MGKFIINSTDHNFMICKGDVFCMTGDTIGHESIAEFNILYCNHQLNCLVKSNSHSMINILNYFDLLYMH